MPTPYTQPEWAIRAARVRRAGWTFNHDDRMWHHTDGRFIRTTQAAILRSLDTGEPIELATIRSPATRYSAEEVEARRTAARIARVDARVARPQRPLAPSIWGRQAKIMPDFVPDEWRA